MTNSRQGACHCKAVRFEVELIDDLNTARRCNCSYCGMRGYIAVSADLSGLKIIAGEDKLSIYQFNTKTAMHYFCKICGIHTHHQRRSNPNQFGINVACLEGVSPFDFTEVQVANGFNHPRDGGSDVKVAGVLKFEKTR